MSRSPLSRDYAFPFDPPPSVIRGERCRAVAAHFGVDDAPDATARRRPRCPIASPLPGELLLINGPSGLGKSSLLRSLRVAAKRRGVATLDLSRVALPAVPVLELFDDADVADTLRRLARVGLAEVWTWLRPPAQLSVGQRWRLRLALAIARAERLRAGESLCLVCDEFAAVLDRVSASVVATVLRRAIDAMPDRLCAVLATSHDDLVGALAPDRIVDCDFGQVAVRDATSRTRAS